MRRHFSQEQQEEALVFNRRPEPSEKLLEVLTAHMLPRKRRNATLSPSLYSSTLPQHLQLTRNT